MYLVIFTAEMANPDQAYLSLAATLRAQAINDYGCTRFVSSCQGTQEIALSYWPDLESIKRWKQDALHKEAQSLGKSTWYSSYRVDICELKQSYSSAD